MSELTSILKTLDPSRVPPAVAEKLVAVLKEAQKPETRVMPTEDFLVHVSTELAKCLVEKGNGPRVRALKAQVESVTKQLEGIEDLTSASVQVEIYVDPWTHVPTSETIDPATIVPTGEPGGPALPSIPPTERNAQLAAGDGTGIPAPPAHEPGGEGVTMAAKPDTETKQEDEELEKGWPEDLSAGTPDAERITWA